MTQPLYATARVGLLATVAGVLLLSLATTPAQAWWFFNKAKNAANDGFAAGKARQKAYEAIADGGDVDANIDAARAATIDSLKKLQDFGTSVPGTSVTGPPPTTVKGGLWQALKETVKWIFSANTRNRAPGDSELAAAIPLGGIALAAQTTGYLDFPYASDSRMAPVIFGSGSFSADFPGLESSGVVFSAADLATVEPRDLGLSLLSDRAVSDALIGEFAAAAPSWDPFDFLSGPDAYEVAFGVEVAGVDTIAERLEGRFIYVAVGPFAEIPQPASLMLLASGLGAAMWSRRRRHQA